MTKNLVYFVVGANPAYISLLQTSIDSLRATSALENIDIAVLCDDVCRPHVLQIDPPVLVHVTQHVLPEPASMAASMQKITIFDMPNIHTYSKAIYLDSDIVVCKDIQKLFDDMVRSDTLYTCSETTFENPHQSIFFSMGDYTPDELTTLNRKGVHGFNCGQFGFHVTQQMQSHFQHVRRMVAATLSAQRPFFYEQSFMNTYFNRHECVDDTLFTPCTDLVPWHCTLSPSDKTILAHFANIDVPLHQKLAFMLKLLDIVKHTTHTSHNI